MAPLIVMGQWLSGQSGTDAQHGEVPIVTDDLIALRAQFPAYKIWREEIPGRVRYVARSRIRNLSPHTTALNFRDLCLLVPVSLAVGDDLATG